MNEKKVVFGYVYIVAFLLLMITAPVYGQRVSDTNFSGVVGRGRLVWVVRLLPLPMMPPRLHGTPGDFLLYNPHLKLGFQGEP